MKNLLMLLLALAFLSSCKKNSDNSSGAISNSSNHTSSFADFTETNVEDMDISTWEDAERYQEATGNYPDGTYCADVEYYNPNTGTRKTYELDVEVENGDLTVINWPNGGWLDNSHFYPESISSGEVSFRSDKGYKYTVTLTDFGGGCYTSSYRMRSDIEEDVSSVTCPNCGGDKYSFDDLCSSCERKKRDEKEEQERIEEEEENSY